MGEPCRSLAEGATEDSCARAGGWGEEGSRTGGLHITQSRVEGLRPPWPEFLSPFRFSPFPVPQTSLCPGHVTLDHLSAGNGWAYEDGVAWVVAPGSLQLQPVSV